MLHASVEDEKARWKVGSNYMFEWSEAGLMSKTSHRLRSAKIVTFLPLVLRHVRVAVFIHLVYNLIVY